jgi:TRAP-type C4-dicarboxylate transport system substrate-binding protein
LWRKATEEALQAVQEAGVQIIRPDKQAFSTRAAPLLDGFRGDPEIGPLIQRIQAVQ